MSPADFETPMTLMVLTIRYLDPFYPVDVFSVPIEFHSFSKLAFVEKG
jgi:hypothetical protein